MLPPSSVRVFWRKPILKDTQNIDRYMYVYVYIYIYEREREQPFGSILTSISFAVQ